MKMCLAEQRGWTMCQVNQHLEAQRRGHGYIGEALSIELEPTKPASAGFVPYATAGRIAAIARFGVNQQETQEPEFKNCLDLQGIDRLSIGLVICYPAGGHKELDAT